MTRTNLSSAFVDRLAELTHMMRRGCGGEPWNLPGIKAAISQVQDTGAHPLDICAVALSAATDQSMRTPAPMASSGKHWTLVESASSLKPTCPHGKEADTGLRTSIICPDCHPKPRKPPGVDWRAIKDAEIAKSREAKAAERAKYPANREGDQP